MASEPTITTCVHNTTLGFYCRRCNEPREEDYPAESELASLRTRLSVVEAERDGYERALQEVQAAIVRRGWTSPSQAVLDISRVCTNALTTKTDGVELSKSQKS